MTLKEKRTIYNQCLDVWGLNGQLLMVMEEMGELTQAISKYLRANALEGTVDSLKEEIVDVYNMVEQMIFIFFPGHIGTQEFEHKINYKLNRLKMRIQIQKKKMTEIEKFKKDTALMTKKNIV